MRYMSCSTVLAQLILVKKIHCHQLIPHMRTGASSEKNKPEVTPQVVESGFKLRSYYKLGLLTNYTAHHARHFILCDDLISLVRKKLFIGK